MSRHSLILALTLLTSACVHRDDPLPVCDGAARRPANPHGSILTPAPAPVVTPAATDLQLRDASPEGGCP